MSGHALSEHTADLVLEAWGEGFDGAVSAALPGLAEAVLGEAPSPREPAAWHPVVSVAPEAELAAVEILNEALYRLVHHGELPVAYRGGPGGGELGTAPLPEGLRPVREVKAVTYAEPRCGPAGGGRWELRVTLDL